MAAPTVADAAAEGSRWGELKKGPTQRGSPNGLDDALRLLVDTNRELGLALAAAREAIIPATDHILQRLPGCQPLSFPRPP